jgi:hypothetical protein
VFVPPISPASTVRGAIVFIPPLMTLLLKFSPSFEHWLFQSSPYPSRPFSHLIFQAFFQIAWSRTGSLGSVAFGRNALFVFSGLSS